MARILIITSGITSIVNSNVEMAKRLCIAGHQVVYGSYANISDTVTNAGIAYLRLPHLQRLASNPVTANEQLLDAAHDFIESVSHFNFDLAIIDIECHEFIVTGLQVAKKIVLVSTFLSLWRNPTVPPMHYSDQPRGISIARSWRFQTLWLKHAVRKILSNRMQKLKKRGKDRISRIELLANTFGFALSKHKDETQWLNPFFYKGLPVINLNDAELDFPQRNPNNAYFVGPMMNLDNPEQLSEKYSGENNLLQEILQKEVKNLDRLLIYCAFGRFKDSYDSALISKIIEAGKRHPEWDVMISLGGQMQRELFPSLPSNVSVFSWLPQARILSHASCAVIHAGISSINECIWFRVPMVLYSANIRDQNGNAARIDYRDLGVVGDRKADRVDDIEQRILQAMEKPEIELALATFQRNAARYLREKTLESVVSSLLS